MGHPGAVAALPELDLATGKVAREDSVARAAAVRVDNGHVWVASYLTNELLGFEREPSDRAALETTSQTKLSGRGEGSARRKSSQEA